MSFQEENIEEIENDTTSESSNIICPHCGHIHPNKEAYFDMGEEESKEVTCNNCGENYELTMSYVIRWTTCKIN